MPYVTIPGVIATLTVVLVLGIGGWMTTIDAWYRNLQTPSWNPPDWVFGPAWTLILGLAGWSAVLAWNHAADRGERSVVLALFGVNIVLHMLWSPLFFNLRRPDWALIEIPFLWLSIVALILVLAPRVPRAGWLLAPYLVWVSFAAFLNFTIVRMNRQFS